MKTILLSDIETNLKSIMQDIAFGNELAITREENNETVAVIVPYAKWQKTQKRQLGTLKNKGTVIFEPDFKMTGEEMIDL